MRRSWAAVLLVLVPALPARATSATARGWCGSEPGRPLDAVWAHREQQARHGTMRAAASPAAAASVYGQVAVLPDEGDLALFRNPLDLSGVGLRFAPLEGGGYQVTKGALSLAPDAGTTVPLGDDDSREIALPFSFPFYGRRFDRAFLNSDGNLTFGVPDAASSPRRVGRLVGGPPRIAPLLTDLDPSAGGAVATQALGDRFVVTWRSVPSFDSTFRNTFEAVLYADGRIELTFGTELNSALEEGVTGVAPGQAEGGLLPMDFVSASGQATGGAFAESFRSTDELDEVAVTRKYFQFFPDDVDQLVIFTSRRLIGRRQFAYERGVMNLISGIGDQLYDLSEAYGSAGRLASFVMMDAISKYPDDPAQVFLGNVDSTLSVLAHETGHRWLARALIPDGGDVLLGRQRAHWSFYMMSSGSFLEGNEIQDLGGGQFRTGAASVRYGPLDQYLMGLRAPEEVPSFFHVADASLGPSLRDEPPTPNTPFSGLRRDVSVDDVIAALGRRSPRVGDAPTVHRQSFVFIPFSGPASEADLGRVERIRAAFPAFYAAGTEGRGQVDPRVN